MTLVIKDHVKETTTTTGVGAITLSGAMLGFQSFSSKCAVGDTVFYGIHAVDGGGAPSGEWECGLGTYSSANTLTRTTVTSSSNSDSAVSFSAGTKHVYIAMPAAQVAWTREKLTANRTYYVATIGSDSADGLTAGTPFLTIQKAVDVICDKIDFGPYQVTIQLADGTYTAGAALKGYVGFLPPVIKGNTTTPANTLISTSTAALSSFTTLTAPISTNPTAFNSYSTKLWVIKDMKIASARSAFEVVGSGNAINFSNIDFGVCAFHIIATNGGAVNALGSYKISGAASSGHWLATTGAQICVRDITVTLLLSVSIGYFAWARFGGIIICPGLTLTLGGFTVTGQKYYAEMNSVISTNGAGASYLPGSVAGSVATGGQYA